MNDILFILLVVVAITVGLGIYLAPTMVAINRRHPSRWLILVVNLLFGMTLVGWLIALVWAVSEKGGVIDSVGRVIVWVCLAFVVMFAAIVGSAYLENAPQETNKPIKKQKAPKVQSPPEAPAPPVASPPPQSL